MPGELLEIYRALEAARVLSAVELGGAEELLWADCDLASLAENRLGDAADPRAIDAARREDWRARATDKSILLPSERASEACFWLLEAGERVGTVALSPSLAGSQLVRLSSLYVFLSQRGRGVGARSLLRLREGLAARGLGIRLDTVWSWQPAVRFYLRTGHWVHSWKHDLAFRWEAGAPPSILRVGSREASLCADLGGRRLLLARAERDGDFCVFHEPAPADLGGEEVDKLAWYAASTLSVGLALHGWPLLRSRQAWEECRHADSGAPEALAHRIALWEAWDHQQGFRVATPKIPGLSYPTWESLEAVWNAERVPTP